MSSDKNVPPDGIDLAVEERAAIDHYHQLRERATMYDLLGVAPGADRRGVRDAYFTLSKRFHPDVFFKREIGVYRTRVEEIFRALTKAYDVLGNAKQRAAYDQHLASHGIVQSAQPRPAPMPSTTPVAMGHGAREGASPRASSPGMPAAAATAATVSAPPRAALPSDAVVPPSLRTLLETSGSRAPAPPATPAPGAPVDLVARQRAMEAMARRLGAGARKPGGAVGSSPPSGSSPSVQPATPQQIADERAAKAAAFVAKAEEAQKHGDLASALESYKGALQFAKDDPALKGRADSVAQLIRLQQVSEHIEKAKEEARAGRAESAATHWEKAWEGRREDAALLLNAAEVLAKHTREHKRAADIAQRVLAIDPRLAKAHLILASVFIEAGLKASARGALDHAARLEPNNPAVKELRDKLGPLSIAEQFGLRGRQG